MSQATRILLALLLGLAVGAALGAWAPAVAKAGLVVADPIGSAWLHGLQMTVVPLVFGLLVTGIAATAEAARAGAIALRAVVIILIVMTLSATEAAFVTPALLDLAPLPAGAAQALRSALSGAVAVGPAPPLSEFVSGIVPTNVIAAASGDAFLPLIVFTLAFGFAVTRLAEGPRKLMTDLFQALVETMLVVVNWVLWVAPIGVAALAFSVGAKAGTAAFGALLHYVLIVAGTGAVMWAAAYLVAVFAARLPLSTFARAAGPSQAVALSTQSSLASLPAMLKGSEAVGVPVATSGLVLPLCVALMRATGPAMNLGVAIYVAHWFGIAIGPAQMASGVLVATVTSLGSVSLPGQVSFIAAISPIAVVLGAPLAPLGLLVAVETFPDLMRTVGNVTMDIAVNATVYRRTRALS